MSVAETKPTVLIVDDEQMVLTSLSTFLELETEYEVHAFLDPREALEFGRGQSVDIVISDYLMPGMDGIAFLRDFRELRPHAPRILLTGYADKENAIKAINEVQVFQYIEKPWENEQLHRIVIAGLERLMLLRLLTEKVDELAKTRSDLTGLRKALVRTFA